MDKTVRASIAGIAFILDEKAYHELRTYLDRLAEAYSSNPDGPEIISDIEARIAEIILSRQTSEQVVEVSLVEDIAGQLGAPEDDGAQTLPQEGTPGTVEDNRSFPRRLYRKPQGAKLAGVCNGLATYFDTDPVWVRLGFFVPLILAFFTAVSGFERLNGPFVSLTVIFVILYFVMWIVVPVARTPRQKLEMKGQKITAARMGRVLSEEEPAIPAESGKPGSVYLKLFGMLGVLLLFGVKFTAMMVGIGFAVASIVLIVVIVLLAGGRGLPWVDGIYHTPFELDGLIGNFTVSTDMYAALLLGLTVIPMVILAYQLIRIIFELRNSRTVMWILGGGWLLLLIYTGALTVYNFDRIRDNARDNMEARREWKYERRDLRHGKKRVVYGLEDSDWDARRGITVSNDSTANPLPFDEPDTEVVPGQWSEGNPETTLTEAENGNN